MKKKKDKVLEQFIKDRDKAFTAWVMDDDFSAAVTYCLNYGVELPDDIDVFKLGMYKGALDIKRLPKEVRETAKKKLEAFRVTLKEKYG